MSYPGELRTNVRPLAAASLGSGAGLMLMSYVGTILGPYLVRAFRSACWPTAICKYAGGDISWSSLRERGFDNYALVLSALGAFTHGAHGWPECRYERTRAR